MRAGAQPSWRRWRPRFEPRAESPKQLVGAATCEFSRAVLFIADRRVFAADPMSVLRFVSFLNIFFF